ncbi:MAG: hypothetical protein ACLPX5_01510 [Dissulfurispiraceae bacterium]
MRQSKKLTSIKTVSSITGKPLDSLLSRFINDKINAYLEPLRLGTPKGDKIGYSLKKYQAMLLCLYNWEKKKVAEIAGVSYGLLRKWRTEEEFKKRLSKNARDFSQRVVDTSYGLVRRGPISFEVHPTLGMLPQCEELFSDSPEYGEEVQTSLWLKVTSLLEMEKVRKSGDRAWEVVAHHIMTILLFSNVMDEELREKILLGYKDMERGRNAKMKFLYDDATRILSSTQALGKSDKQKLQHIFNLIMKLSGIDKDRKNEAEK